MIVSHEIASLVEEFKAPYKNPYCPADWKDWYHYVLYDPKTGIKILYNICFNGKPQTGYVTDTFYITLPKGYTEQRIVAIGEEESFGFARNQQWKEGALQTAPLSYQGKDLRFRISTNNIMNLAVSHADFHIDFHFHGAPAGQPVYVPEPAPYGKGFIGWGVMPAYQMSGEIKINNRVISITDDWYCYHDRNFGRFNWGNIGWTWFVARSKDAEGDEWTYVLHKSNNADYSKTGAPILFVHKNRVLQKVFIGDTVSIETEWSEQYMKPSILPGAMASVFADRMIREPLSLTIQAIDEHHQLRLYMPIKSFTELIVPDSESKAYTFLKEMSGPLEVTQKLHGASSKMEEGFFYAELVH